MQPGPRLRTLTSATTHFDHVPSPARNKYAPVLPHQGLEPVDVYAHAVGAAAAVPRSPPLAYPAVEGEVGRLCQVEAVVKAAVIGSWEGDHELAGLLDAGSAGNMGEDARNQVTKQQN